jgi:hypothetical protein
MMQTVGATTCAADGTTRGVCLGTLCRASAWRADCGWMIQARPSSSSSGARASVAPGTCSDSRARARIRTCSPTPTASGRGRTSRCWPTARRSATTWMRRCANMASGRRSADSRLPRQGRKAPWRVTHDYFLDKPALLDEPIRRRHPRIHAAARGGDGVGRAGRAHDGVMTGRTLALAFLAFFES